MSGGAPTQAPTVRKPKRRGLMVPEDQVTRTEPPGPSAAKVPGPLNELNRQLDEAVEAAFASLPEFSLPSLPEETEIAEANLTDVKVVEGLEPVSPEPAVAPQTPPPLPPPIPKAPFPPVVPLVSEPEKTTVQPAEPGPAPTEPEPEKTTVLPAESELPRAETEVESPTSDQDPAVRPSHATGEFELVSPPELQEGEAVSSEPSIIIDAEPKVEVDMEAAGESPGTEPPEPSIVVDEDAPTIEVTPDATTPAGTAEPEVPELEIVVDDDEPTVELVAEASPPPPPPPTPRDALSEPTVMVDEGSPKVEIEAEPQVPPVSATPEAPELEIVVEESESEAEKGMEKPEPPEAALQLEEQEPAPTEAPEQDAKPDPPEDQPEELELEVEVELVEEEAGQTDKVRPPTPSQAPPPVPAEARAPAPTPPPIPAAEHLAKAFASPVNKSEPAPPAAPLGDTDSTPPEEAGQAEPATADDASSKEFASPGPDPSETPTEAEAEAEAEQDQAEPQAAPDADADPKPAPKPPPTEAPPPVASGEATSDAAPATEEQPPEPRPAAEKEAKPEPSEPAAQAPAPQKTQQQRVPLQKGWFEDFFDDDYLLTLPHETPESTIKEAEFIINQLSLPEGGRVLDVGCGYGRHAMELAAQGFKVVGLDRSLPMLIRAGQLAEQRGLEIDFMHGDMREMNFELEFDGVYCVTTTFGYFDDETNRNLLRSIYRALKPGGKFLLEAVNRDFILSDLPMRVWWEGEGCLVMEEVDLNYFTSRLESSRSVVFNDGRQIKRNLSIRVYSLHEIGKLLHNEGFRVLEVTGHVYTERRFFGHHSPQLIIKSDRKK